MSISCATDYRGVFQLQLTALALTFLILLLPLQIHQKNTPKRVSLINHTFCLHQNVEPHQLLLIDIIIVTFYYQKQYHTQPWRLCSCDHAFCTPSYSKFYLGYQGSPGPSAICMISLLWYEARVKLFIRTFLLPPLKKRMNTTNAFPLAIPVGALCVKLRQSE